MYTHSTWHHPQYIHTNWHHKLKIYTYSLRSCIMAIIYSLLSKIDTHTLWRHKYMYTYRLNNIIRRQIPSDIIQIHIRTDIKTNVDIHPDIKINKYTHTNWHKTNMYVRAHTDWHHKHSHTHWQHKYLPYTHTAWHHKSYTYPLTSWKYTHTV